ncbi:MAG: hypothetical protein R3E39_11485 [Anaerolineae bacterium]
MKNIKKKAAAIIFIIVVAFSGLALASSGNMDNPFQVITQLTQSAPTEGGRPELPSGEMAAPPTDRSEFQSGGEQSDSFNWTEVSGIFSHLWFVAAASAFVMVIGTPIGLTIKKLQSLASRPAAA